MEGWRDAAAPPGAVEGAAGSRDATSAWGRSRTATPPLWGGAGAGPRRQSPPPVAPPSSAQRVGYRLRSGGGPPPAPFGGGPPPPPGIPHLLRGPRPAPHHWRGPGCSPSPRGLTPSAGTPPSAWAPTAGVGSGVGPGWPPLAGARYSGPSPSPRAASAERAAPGRAPPPARPGQGAPSARVHLNPGQAVPLLPRARERLLRDHRGVYLAGDQPIFVATSGERALPHSLLLQSPVLLSCCHALLSQPQHCCPDLTLAYRAVGGSLFAKTPKLSPPSTGDDSHRGFPAPEPSEDGGSQGSVVPSLRAGSPGPHHTAGRPHRTGKAEHPLQTPLARQAQHHSAHIQEGPADCSPQDACAAHGHGSLPRDAP